MITVDLSWKIEGDYLNNSVSVEELIVAQPEI